SGLTWDESTLDAFLTSSTQKVPGTSMPVALPDARIRSAIIAYLKSVAATTAVAPAAAPAEAAKPSGGPTQWELNNAAASTHDWLYASKDYTGQRFVKLSQINTKNVHDLRPICMYRSETAAPTQTNPLVYKGVMYLTVDSSIVAIDAATCRQRWSANWGAKNWIGAFQLATGEPVWRFNLIPDDNEPGADSWKDPKAREHGGGSLWTPLALDVDQGIVYVPVGNPSPDFYGSVREGDNLYTNSALALDVHTGKLLWYRQFISNDVHDADLSQVSPIFSATVRGKARKLITVSGKDGLL